MTTLARWREAFDELDACPWPGPRPLTNPDERHLLIGRDEDLDRFASDVLEHRLIVLTGESGVGKSSFLKAGVVGTLIEEGFWPLLCDDWSASGASQDDPEGFVASILEETGELAPLDLAAASGPLLATLDEVLGHTGVLVLDQFEELIRYQPALFERTMDWLARASRAHKTHVVLSLRAEYAHRLASLPASALPGSVVNYPLKPLTSRDVIQRVITSPDDPAGSRITSEATAALCDIWARHAEPGGADWQPIGLLHLQAVLYSLHARRPSGPVTGADVREMEMEAGDRTVFTVAMRQAIRRKLDRCEAACAVAAGEGGVDAPLVVGTRGLVRRIARHLSSGGYKLVRDEYELGMRVLEPEMRRLGLTEEEQRGVMAALGSLDTGAELGVPAAGKDGGGDPDGDNEAGSAARDLLTARRGVVLARAGLAVPTVDVPKRLTADGLDTLPWTVDPGDVTSGPMLALPPLAVGVEEFRRFAFALRWLHAARLVRASSPVPGQRMLSLIHDGFARALEEWAGAERVPPEQALHLLTAAQGEVFRWQDDGGAEPAWPALDGASEVRVIANARWRDCEISASFRRVIFLNCDLRGTRFVRSSFAGVVFVNCLLDNATFGNCAIRGSIDVDALPGREGMPDFRVEVPAAAGIAHALRRYRELPSASDALYSVTSGVPALPWDAARGEGTPWKPQEGGLTVYGGRLNSLMVRACSFPEGGVLALRHIAGSSLDIVEQASGRIDVYRGVIRGLTITPPIEGTAPDGEALTLHANDCVLAETWFGEGLAGGAEIEFSQLWQLWNLSDRARFDVRISDCAYTGIVNVAPPDENSVPIAGAAPDRIDVGRFAGAARTMDFRSTPARFELEQRAARRFDT